MSSINSFIPHKKPRKSKHNPEPHLTEQQKEENKTLSKIKLVVEHVIAGIKIFRCLSDKFRNHNKLLEDIFIGISAAIWYLKIPFISIS